MSESEDSRDFVWINTEWIYDDRVHELGVHADVLLIQLATFAARGEPPGTLTAEAVADCFDRHKSGPDADEVDPEVDLAKIVAAGFATRGEDGSVTVTAPELFVYGNDPGADVHLMSVAKRRKELGEEDPELFP